jgi:hypothetical protein
MRKCGILASIILSLPSMLVAQIGGARPLVGTTKFTRALEPTLLWNHFTHPVKEDVKKKSLSRPLAGSQGW